MNASAGHEHKHFSPCSSKQIWRFLGTPNSHCLTKLHQTGIKLFSTRALKLGQKEMSEFKGMSMDEQCKIFVNDTVAVSRTSEVTSVTTCLLIFPASVKVSINGIHVIFNVVKPRFGTHALKQCV